VVFDREQAVDGLDLVCLGIVTGEPLQGIAGSPGPHSRSHGRWVLSNRESWSNRSGSPGGGEDDDARGLRARGSGSKLPVSDRITRVSVQASRTGYRRTVVPECRPTAGG